MIKRYSRKELTDIWSEKNKYQIWLDVEVAAAEAMEKLGQIPKGVASVVKKKAKINVNRIQKIESEVWTIYEAKKWILEVEFKKVNGESFCKVPKKKELCEIGLRLFQIFGWHLIFFN